MKKVVLITGSSSGIGNASAKLFAKEGWHVIGVDINEIGDQNGINHFIQANVAEIADSNRIFAEITDDEGHINALVNNAAIQICKPFIDTGPDEWDMLMRSNLTSAYLTVRHAYPLLKIDGGSIVNISSVHGIATSINIAAYAASKGALISLTRALAIEFASDNIRVNSILPGAIDTPMLRAGLYRGHLDCGESQKMLEKLSQKTVIGRIGKPAEVAQAILFLADESRSSFITGQMLVVDGGATARLSTE
jgi:NAD(P)-dependent dehydrogenase (short-subunit alcohol dehydrogenase family)